MKTIAIILDFQRGGCVEVKEVPENLARKDIQGDELMEALGYNSSNVAYMISHAPLTINFNTSTINGNINIE